MIGATRKEYTLNNILFGVGQAFVKDILGFISRTIFIKTLGATYLGVNGLMISILSMLSLAELGVGTAITYSLYKPLVNEDHTTINLLMAFYKKAYRIISLVIFVLGLIAMLFLKVIIKDYQSINNLYLIYFIFLVTTAYSYNFSYKRTIISADQKGYLLIPFTTVSSLLVVIISIIELIIFKNYIAYLLIQFIDSLLENIFVNGYINKKYNYINSKVIEKLPKDELDKLIKNVKAMFMHTIGDYVLNSTDNIVISSFISISMVGLYSNYLLLISAINAFLMILFNSATASFGNLIAKESREKSLNTFRIFNFMGFWIFGWATVCFYTLLNPFISLWIGKSFIIDQAIINVVLLNFYITGMRVPLSILKMAAGVYTQDRFVPIIQSVNKHCADRAEQ
jgi:O-antigen/teichoic acid export membrane protein